MRKHTRKQLDLKEPIHRLITVGEFLQRVKSDPNSTHEDFNVRYAVEKLSDACLFDNDKSGGKALLTFVSYKRKLKLVSGKTFKNNPEKILEKAGLKAYILKHPRRTLDKYRHNPERLLLEVDTLTNELRESLPKRGRKHTEIIRVLNEKSKQRFNRGLSKKAVRKIPEQDAHPVNTCRNFALRIVADMNYVSFKTLYNLYWELKKSVKEPISDKSFLHSDNQAYNNYLRREHFRHEFNEVFERLVELDVSKRLAEAVEEIIKPFQILKELTPPKS
ncbi:hypothetical protein MYX76_12725 [Desulfobacterota bacterium AH_259_B03_O07]|nr:hypothetical protein [Desulfobacterota bacterium AH_259_B03_O07]